MLYGLYTAAAGSLIEKAKLEIVSNNLANVDTTGFRKAYVNARERLAETQAASGRSVSMSVLLGGGGVFLDRVQLDSSAGAVQETQEPLDLAIDGSGFFGVSDGENTYYTRAGSFTIDAENQIATPDGRYRLLGGGGEPLTLSGGASGGPVTVTKDGVIYQGANEIGRLKLADFTDLENLEARGDNTLLYTGDGGEIASTARVRQGYLEKSNASTVQELSEMILAMRSYEASNRMLRTFDTTLQRTVNDVGAMPR
ncbi:MAG: flagellar hook-basal body protein [Planctomycetota bacterium]